MAEEFYKIEKAEASKVYKEWTDENGIHRIIEACNEQEDGTLLIAKSEYEKIKDDTEVKKIDWSKKTLIREDEVASKTIEISGEEPLKEK